MALLGKILGKPLKPEQFMEAVRLRIASKYPSVKITSELDYGFECEVDGSNISLFLDSAYADYLGRPRELTSIIDHLVRAMLLERVDEFVPWAEAKHRIYPSLKPEGYFDCIRQMQEGDAVVDNMITFEWQKGLRIVMVLDFERSMRFVRKEELETWQISPEELREQAMKNLAAKTGPLWEPVLDRARKSKMVRFAAMDGYDASRILLPDLPDRSSRALDSEKIAVVIPIRDLLMAFPYTNDGTDQRLKQETEKQYAQGNHPVSPDIFILTSE